MSCIFRGLDVGPDVCHREAVVGFTCTRGALHQILVDFVNLDLTAAVDADILAWTDFLACLRLFRFS